MRILTFQANAVFTIFSTLYCTLYLAFDQRKQIFLKADSRHFFITV